MRGLLQVFCGGDGSKRRKKLIFGALKRHLGEIFHELAGHKESKIVEGHLMGDHVHMCISIPPKYAVSNVVGYIKGKRAIQIARKFGGRQRNFTGGSRFGCVKRPAGERQGGCEISRQPGGALILRVIQENSARTKMYRRPEYASANHMGTVRANRHPADWSGVCASHHPSYHHSKP